MAIKNVCWGIVLLLFCGLLHQGQLSCTLNPGGGQVVHFDINPETIIINNLIGEERLKEIIFGTKDEKLAVLNSVSLGVHFLIHTEGNVTHIGVADINNDGQNELVFTTENNFLCTYDCNGCVLYKKNLEEESPDDDILDFTFLDVNKDGATDIIVGTSSGIKAIDGTSVSIKTTDATEQTIWSFTDRSLPGMWPLPEGSSLHLTTADIDNFGEKEIIGYTENTVFALSYSGGILWKKDFNKITALSIYNDPKFYPDKRIMVALADGTLFKIDCNGNLIPWSNEEISKDIGMTASKIVPSKSDATSDKHTFFFIISDEKEAKAFTFSGEEINFEFNSNILDIECANLDNKDTYQYPTRDYEEIVVLWSNGEVRTLIYRENKLSEFPLEFQDEVEPSEEVRFSKLVEKDKNSFIFFRVLKKRENEIWKIQKDEIFDDVVMFFSFYREAEENYSNESYYMAFVFYDILYKSPYYTKMAEYYELSDTILKNRTNCHVNMKEARNAVIQDIKDLRARSLEKENERDFLGAIVDSYEAYKKFNTLELYNGIMGFIPDEEQRKEIEDNYEAYKKFNTLELYNGIMGFIPDEEQRKEIEDKILQLLFILLHETHQKYEQRIYEEAHKNFLGIYPIHGEFSLRMKNFVEENVAFGEYEYLIEEYQDQDAIIKAMDECVKGLKKDAENFFDNGKFKEAKSTYEAIEKIVADKKEKGVPYTVEYTEEEIDEKISDCNKEIKKKRNIYIFIGIFIAFFSVLIFRYRKEIDKRFFQKERWTTEELYDRLDESEKLLNTGYPEPAANLAGKVLEKALKMYIRKDTPLYQKWNPEKDPRKDKRAPLGGIIPWLHKHDPAIDEIQTSKLDMWRKIRNRSSHDTEEEVHEFDVNEMIEGIREFVSRYLESKY